MHDRGEDVCILKFSDLLVHVGLLLLTFMVT